MELQLSQLQAIMPRLPEAKARRYLPLLQSAMDEAHIDTPLRVAAFLAQLAHESGELRWFEEFATGDAYEGRRSLGNTQPGDGRRFKGRGPIQLTGRTNYRRAGHALGLHLEERPWLASVPENGFRIAAWYWASHRCNELADASDFEGVTRAINGGMSHWHERVAYYERALRQFNALA